MFPYNKNMIPDFIVKYLFKFSLIEWLWFWLILSVDYWFGKIVNGLAVNNFMVVVGN